MKRLCVFASGNGSNAINLYNYFKGSPRFSVELVVTNNPEAGVISKAGTLKIPLEIVPRQQFETEILIDLLKIHNIDVIVLAGFLRLIPQILLKIYPDRIVNIHPALLPDFGGKGMYGIKVHDAVIAAEVIQSGITIHLVNEHYDKGKILFQKTITLDPKETAETLASRIHDLEYNWYPKVIEEWMCS